MNRKMKILLILSSVFLVFYLFFIKSWLPYDLKIFKNAGDCLNSDGYVASTIYDKDGFPLISGCFDIIIGEKKIKKILKYTTNRIGLVVYMRLIEGDYLYVVVNPQPEEKQVYSETLWDYEFFKAEEYEGLDLGSSWWHTINFE